MAVETYAPDTLREHELTIGGTVPMPAHTAPLPQASTAPLEEPLPPLARTAVATAPLAMPAKKPEALTYEIYTPDDTWRGRPAVHTDSREQTRRRRFALGLLAFGVAVATTLAAIGSLEDSVPSPSAAGRVETTSATLTIPTSTGAASPAPAVPAAVNEMAPITFSPPLGPVPSAPRRRIPHPLPKRIP